MSWFRQFTVLVTKNCRLIQRRPIHLLILLLSSIISVVLAWAAGRDVRGPSGNFPQLNSCGMVDENSRMTINEEEDMDRYSYYDYETPISMNEAWRGGLPIWIMSLGPTFSAISAFLILRDELQSKRWGMLKAADSSSHWVSWLFVFTLLAIINSLLGGVVAAAVPNAHVLQNVNFASVFGSLLFLNVALVGASFFLVALCGTIGSAALTVFLVMGIIVAGSTPFIAASTTNFGSYYSYLGTSHDTGAGTYWKYSSTERTSIEYGSYDEITGIYDDTITSRVCEVPLVSFEQSRYYKTPEERDNVPLDEIGLGCYVVAGSPARFNSFFWYLIPQTHFLAAWSNVLGYTSLPGTTFTFADASKSPEVLSKQALLTYNGGEDYNETKSYGTSLFEQGAHILPESYYDYTQNYDYYYNSNGELKSTCPSSNVVPNMCSDTDTECYNPRRGFPTDSNSPSVNDDLGLLGSLVVVYSFLAAYFSAVVPMGNGAASKWYFPVSKAFWCSFCRGGNRKSIDDNGEQDGVEAINVSKRYGKVEALKPLSLTMKPSQVTALLGHNGAGKSTFVNVLCCEQNQTSGDINVMGLDLSDQHQIRKIIGECRQDDILWPNLTAREHLELFAGIRGVPKHEMAQTIQEWLESVDLDEVQHSRVSSFSGGMKRRLSVAMSTIGGSKVIVLDEPSTGMDPVSRRFVWQHISAIKRGRVILLTTHAMEEADLLSDQVAIMCNGELAAVGSPLDLKHKYGSALQLTLISEKEDAALVEQKVKDVFSQSLPYIEFESGTSGYSTLTIKKIYKTAISQAVYDENEDGDKVKDTPTAVAVTSTESAIDGVLVQDLSSFIGWCEEDNSPVNEFGISNSSLEEVFLTVTKHAPPPVARLEQKRGCCSCCCGGKRRQVTTPETSAEDVTTSNVQSSNTAMNQLPKVDMTTYKRKLSLVVQVKAIFRFMIARSWSGRPSIINWVIFSIFCIGTLLTGFGMAMLWPEGVWFSLLIPVIVLSFMLISIISPIFSDRNAGLFKMLSTQSMKESSFLIATSLYSLFVEFIYAFVLLTLFFGSPVFRRARTPEDCLSTDDWNCGYASFGERGIVDQYYEKEVLSYNLDDGTDVSIYAYFSSGGYGMILGIIFAFSLTFPGAVLSTAFLPGYKITLVGISLVLMVACAAPLIYYTTNFVSYPQSVYYLGNCTTYADTIGRSFTLDEVTDGEFVKWAGAFISDPLVYCAPSYVSLLPQFGLFQTLALTLFSNVVFYSDPPEYAEMLVDTLKQSGEPCSGTTCQFEYARQLYGEHIGYMLLGALLLLILGFIMSTLFLYPTAIMIRGKHAVGKLLKCRKKKEDASGSEEQIEELPEVDEERQRVHSIMQDFQPESNVDNVDGDVEAPRGGNLPPVIMHNLRKVFPPLGGAPAKVALKSLDLHVPKGEVLGLLGKNGAGKTTALKVLAGVHEASSGVGLISGFDVSTELAQVYERLGNCPQFDIVWKNQSVQRHLEFYARLKGIDNPNQAAKDIADAVGLGAPDVYTRQSGALSGKSAFVSFYHSNSCVQYEASKSDHAYLLGGMRRRLSIAVSLLGSPECLLLDEPTTGLDPSTRNEIWSLVSSFATPERAIIITTHMMLEADALCSRIAIVAKGSLKVVGTQQHLKDNYGSGYLLQLNLAYDNEETVNSLLEFVQTNISKEAKIVTKQAKTVHINLPREVNIQTIFTTLYSDEAAEAMVNQFLVSQSSLEDVFLALGE